MIQPPVMHLATASLQQNLHPQFPEYNVGTEISRIVALNNNGAKVCLFAGRTETENLPEEPGTIWVSLDEQMNSMPLNGRIHLWMNLNNDDQMARIRDLFDKVVLDQSVLKFIGNPWARLGALLKPGLDSVLITEADTGQITNQELMRQEHEQGEAYFNNYTAVRTPEQLEVEYKEFIAQMPAEDREFYLDWGGEKELKTAFRNHIIQAGNLPDLMGQYIENRKLENLERNTLLFNEAQLVRDTNYPYPTRWCDGHSDFFVLKGWRRV